MPKVVYTKPATLALKEIWRFIARQNNEAANKLDSEIRQKCRTYAERPHIGRLTEEYGDDVRRFPYGSYVIFYKPLDDGIAVLHVWHGMRNFPDLFPPEDGKKLEPSKMR